MTRSPAAPTAGPTGGGGGVCQEQQDARRAVTRVLSGRGTARAGDSQTGGPSGARKEPGLRSPSRLSSQIREVCGPEPKHRM